MADAVLPATMFLEHDDIYRGGGQQHVVAGPKLIDPPAGPRSNHEVIEELAVRLGVSHLPEFGHEARWLIDNMARRAGIGSYDDLVRNRWADLQPDFAESHFLNGFGHPDGKFHFRPDWTQTPSPNRPPQSMGILGPAGRLPEFPDYFEAIEIANPDHPFRLATSPAHSFLNSSFSETPASKKREGRPELLIHPEDAAEYGVADGARVEIGNERGDVVLHVRHFTGTKRGVVIAEGIWPNAAHERGEGINTLTGADPVAPYGGAAFHDNHVWLREI
jgi:anaerobic selenocysteine-containing dehydrogenase